MRTLIHGLRRLMPSPWRALTSLRRSLRRSRRRRWWWRRVQRLALQLAFGLCGSARGSSSTSWDGQGGGVPMAIGAPSHTHGPSFTRKPQPMSMSSPRTYLIEVVVSASGPGRRWRGGGGGGTVQCFIDDVVDIPVGNSETFRRAFLPVHRQSDAHSSCSCGTGARWAQLCRRPWRFRLWTSLSDKFLQSTEFHLIVPQIQFIVRVWAIPVVQQRRVCTVQLVQKTGDSTAPVQVLEVVDMPVVVRWQALGCSQWTNCVVSAVAVL